MLGVVRKNKKKKKFKTGNKRGLEVVDAIETTNQFKKQNLAILIWKESI